MASKSNDERPLLGAIVNALEAPNTCLSGQPQLLSYLSLSTEYSIEKGKLITEVKRVNKDRKGRWYLEDIDLPEQGLNITEIFWDEIRIISSVNNQSPDWCNGKKTIPKYYYSNYRRDKIESMHQWFIATKNNIFDIAKINKQILQAIISRYSISSEEKCTLQRYANDCEKPYFLLAYAWFQAVITYKEFNQIPKPKLIPLVVDNADYYHGKIEEPIFNALYGRNQIIDLISSNLDKAFEDLSILIPEEDCRFDNFILIWGHYCDYKAVFGDTIKFSPENKKAKQLISEELIHLTDCLPNNFYTTERLNKREQGVNHQTRIKKMVAVNLDRAFDEIMSIIPDTLPLRAILLSISSAYKEKKSELHINANTEQNYFKVVKHLRVIRQDLINFVSFIPPRSFGIGMNPGAEMGSTVTFFSQYEGPDDILFPNLIKNATKLHISAMTAIGLLTVHEKEFTELISSGCDLRFLVFDYESVLAKYIFKDDILHKKNANQSRECLNRLYNLTDENGKHYDNLKINTTNELLNFSIIYGSS